MRSRLEAALRAGHGIGARLSFVLTSGPAPTLELRPSDLVAERWLSRALVAAYGPGAWQRAPPPPLAPPRPAWNARVSLLASTPGLTRPEPGTLLHGLVAGFLALPQGTTLELGLCPVRGPGALASWLASRPASSPSYPASKLRGPLASRRPRLEEVVEPVSGPSWSASLRLFPSSAGPAPSEAKIVEAVWRTCGGEAIRFRRHGFLDRGSVVLLDEATVLALLPTPGLAALASSREAPHCVGLAVGRERSGSVVALPVAPEEGRHALILGETGMGKSSLLVALARRAARLGGVILLDPLGETARSLRAELETESDRVTFLAPGNPGASLNALEGCAAVDGPEGLRAERRRDDLLHALRRVRAGRYAEQSYWGPRIEEMVGRALRAAAALPGGTLEDAHALLSQVPIPRRAAPSGAEEAVHELLLRVRDRPDDAEGARRLLYEVVRSPTLRSMLSSREPSLHASDLVRPGRIVLVCGSAGEVGESAARYLLAVYLAVVWSELLARPTPSKTFVVLDEAEWFAHESLSEMLRVGRRLNAHAVLASQSLASLPKDVGEAVATNVADWVVFRGSPQDARELSRAVGGVTEGELQALPRGSAVVLLGKGERVHRVHTARLPGPGPKVPLQPRLPAEGRSAGAPRVGDAPGPTSKAPRTPRAGDGRAPRPLSGLLSWMRERGAGAPEGRLLAVSLRELADAAAGDLTAVRELGGLLGRSGAIVRRERGPEESRWWIDLKRLPAEAPGRGASESAGERSRGPPPGARSPPDGAEGSSVPRQ